MTTEKYLNQITRLNNYIESDSLELQRLREMSYSISVSVGDERVQTSVKTDKLCNSVSKIVDMENEIDFEIKQYEEKRKKIIYQIKQIENDDFNRILMLRYVNGKTFEEISKITSYALRHIMRLHSKALIEFEDMFGKEYI